MGRSKGSCIRLTHIPQTKDRRAYQLPRVPTIRHYCEGCLVAILWRRIVEYKESAVGVTVFFDK